MHYGAIKGGVNPHEYGHADHAFHAFHAGRRTVREREGATNDDLRKSRTDVLTGMFFSNLVMYFIILTTAATLHAQGKTSIDTAQQAAEALKPVPTKNPIRH